MKLPNFGKIFDNLSLKVPREIAALALILGLIIVYCWLVIKDLKNDVHVTILLIIVLVIALGCTYCLVTHYRSKADERHLKGISKLLGNTQNYLVQKKERIWAETEKAVAMRGENENE